MGNRQRLCAGLALAFACGGGGSPKTAKPSAQAAPDAGSEVEIEAIQIQSIASALNEFSPAVHTCWAHGAADNLQLEGQVVIALEIGEGGASVPTLIEENVGDAVLIDCLLALWESYHWPEVFAVGDQIQLPPFDFVAPPAQYSVALPHVPVYEVGSDGTLSAQVLIDAQNSGNDQAAMTVLTAKPGAEVGLHTHTSAELLFVLRGQGAVLGVGGPQAVEPGSAVYIPAGVVHGFKHTGESDTELVQFYAPGGPQMRFRDSAALTGTTAFEGKLPKRGAKPIVRTAAKALEHKIADGKASIRIIVDEAISGDASAYIGALTAQVGAVVPLHRHANSSEYLLVLEGAAVMQVAGRALQVQAGDAVQLPATVEHGATIVGAEEFKALQFYAPAGPEQRFKGSEAASAAGRR
tara:strand:- start:51828 stop:53054 length:1227 start_codon:yes stop_codon:yes gene_type:complete